MPMGVGGMPPRFPPRAPVQPAGTPYLPPPGPRESTTRYTGDGATSTIPGYPSARIPRAPTGGGTQQMIDALMQMAEEPEVEYAPAAPPKPKFREPVRQRGAGYPKAADTTEEEWRRNDGAVVAPGTPGATMYRVPKGMSRNLASNFPGGGGGGGGPTQSIGADLEEFAEGNKSANRKLYEKQLASGVETGNAPEAARMAAALERSNADYAQRNAVAAPPSRG